MLTSAQIKLYLKHITYKYYKHYLCMFNKIKYSLKSPTTKQLTVYDNPINIVGSINSVIIKIDNVIYESQRIWLKAMIYQLVAFSWIDVTFIKTKNDIIGIYI